MFLLPAIGYARRNLSGNLCRGRVHPFKHDRLGSDKTSRAQRTGLPVGWQYPAHPRHDHCCIIDERRNHRHLCRAILGGSLDLFHLHPHTLCPIYLFP